MHGELCRIKFSLVSDTEIIYALGCIFVRPETDNVFFFGWFSRDFSDAIFFFLNIRFSFSIYPFFSVFVGSKTDIGENLLKIFVSKNLSPNISHSSTNIFKNIRRRIFSKTDNRYFTRIRGASMSTSLCTKTTSHPWHRHRHRHIDIVSPKSAASPFNCNNIDDQESGQRGQNNEQFRSRQQQPT